MHLWLPYRGDRQSAFNVGIQYLHIVLCNMFILSVHCIHVEIEVAT